MGSPVYKKKNKPKEKIFDEQKWRVAELALTLIFALLALYVGTVVPRMFFGESFVIEMAVSIILIIILFPLRVVIKKFVMRTDSLRKLFET